MITYTSILALGLLLTLTAPHAAFASGSQTSTQPPESSSLYRGSGR